MASTAFVRYLFLTFDRNICFCILTVLHLFCLFFNVIVNLLLIYCIMYTIYSLFLCIVVCLLFVCITTLCCVMLCMMYHRLCV